MVYEVEFRPKASKDLARLSPEIARRILGKVDAMIELHPEVLKRDGSGWARRRTGG
jgi:mRNA-degrading endonuclease RelE of RelBE toxin-antitoxin system